MFNEIQSWIDQFLAFSKTHQAIGFALSAWGLTTATYVFRNLPVRIFRFLKSQLTTTLEINNEEQGNNLYTFHNFCRWLFDRKTRSYSRNLMLASGWEKVANHSDGYHRMVGYVGPGDGRHFFFHKGRPFWVSLTSQREGVLHSNIKRTITVTTVGRDHAVITDLIDQFIHKTPPEQVCLYQFNGREWNLRTQFASRSSDAVTLNYGVKEKILERIRVFDASREWYRQAGITYKLGLLFHGPTGTGKTSLARVLASSLNRSMYELNLNTVTDATLGIALSNQDLKKSILLIEDFNDVTAVRARARQDMGPAVRNARLPVPPSSQSCDEEPTLSDVLKEMQEPVFRPLSLSTVLRELDGVAGLEDCIVIFTTNSVMDIDPAILRPGRIDEHYLLDHLHHEAVVRYIQRFVPGYEPKPGEQFAPLAGAVLQSYLLRNPTNYTQFIASIPREACSVHHLPSFSDTPKETVTA